MKMIAVVCLILMTAVSSALADVTVRVHEGGVHEGKVWGEIYTEYYSSEDLRIDVTRDGATSPYMFFLFLRNPDRLYIVQGDSVSLVDRSLLAALETKAGTRAKPNARVVPIGSSHSINGFACTGFVLRRRGLPSRYLCLASAASLNLPAGYVEAGRDMREMLGRLMTALERSGAAGKPKAAAQPSLNTYGLAEGYPVHAWETKGGEVTWENQLLAIMPAPVAPDLFRAPNPAQ